MAYNLYIRKPKHGKLIHPKISVTEFAKAIERLDDFSIQKSNDEVGIGCVYQFRGSSDKMTLELYPNGQIITGWRSVIDYKDPYFKALLRLTSELDCEMVDEFGELLSQ